MIFCKLVYQRVRDKAETVWICAEEEQWIYQTKDVENGASRQEKMTETTEDGSWMS